MTNPLAQIAYDIGQHLEAGESESAIEKLHLLEAEIERANCKHPESARLWTYAMNYGVVLNGKPTEVIAFRCGKCGRYVVPGEDNGHPETEP